MNLNLDYLITLLNAADYLGASKALGYISIKCAQRKGFLENQEVYDKLTEKMLINIAFQDPDKFLHKNLPGHLKERLGEIFVNESKINSYIRPTGNEIIIVFYSHHRR